MILAGLPAIIENAGNDFVTTELAPITEFFPMLTPGSMQTPSPTQTLSPIITGPLENSFLCKGGNESSFIVTSPWL